MNSITNFLKELRLSRLIVVVCAGLILFVSTACSQGTNTKVSKGFASDQNYPAQPSGKEDGLTSGGDTQRSAKDNPPSYRLDKNMERHMKESYASEPYQGGMNEGRDVDRRQNTAAAEKKAEKLVTQAQKRLDKGVTPVENLQRRASVDGVKDKLDEAANKVSDSANDVKEGAKRGFRNLQDNASSAVDEAGKNVKDVLN
ncbi:MAG: hypothetical protein N5P05_001072 [Chroococcopsis gigantea SAG 12.99]|jgi:hypothetical protein|nr:hypothetical protein [Chlorogloea purpurea SAG 13.99]MDV2999466.1 hypothetical protein [Chroococcopsis gigantea SAG 12.99]